MTQDERLQRAWLALCGWQVGMVDTDGEANDGRTDWTEDPDRFPALGSPANWGHWTVALYGDKWAPHIPWRSDYPRNLLTCAIHSMLNPPPEVLDWWKHEIEARCE